MSSRLNIHKAKSKKAANKKEPKEQRTYVDHELEPIEVKRVPEDQLHLTEAELKEEFTKSLQAADPNKAPRVTNFNFKLGVFESQPNDDHLRTHFAMDGIICHRKELEATQQTEDETTAVATETNADESVNENNDETENGDENNNENNENENDENANPDDNVSPEHDSENKASKSNPDSPHKKQTRLTKNQFNYSDRASQTFNQPMRDREIMTEPAPTATFSSNASPFAIFDEYLNNLMRNRNSQTTTNKPTKKQEKKKSEESRIVYQDENDAILNSNELSRAAEIVERIVNQNADQAIYHDFRYFKEEDYKSEPFLLPLWTFRYGDARKKNVTALCWNPLHHDLFAVGFGSYDFTKQTSGVIAVFSLKSTRFPYKIIRVESGVMCLHFHNQHPSLLCVGCYDGSVAVYDIRNSDDTPIYSSENPENYHSDPVWDVRWHTSDLGNEINFFSISSDGIVANWTMSKNELIQEIMMELKQPVNESEIREEDATVIGLASSNCFDFNPFMEHVFLVGTEDGYIHQCSKVYLNGFLHSYKSHTMSVYAVKWSPFHSTTFLSASEDWSVKLWDSEENEPIISYDLNTAVGDIAWAPFSSTVFVAVTNDGKVHVFDLEQNKNGPISSQRVTKKCGLTHVSFGPADPIIIVGDERGVTHCLKLSPQLCKIHNLKPNANVGNNGKQAPGTSGGVDISCIDIEKEGERLEKILSVTGNKVFDLSNRPPFPSRAPSIISV